MKGDEPRGGVAFELRVGRGVQAEGEASPGGSVPDLPPKIFLRVFPLLL